MSTLFPVTQAPAHNIEKPLSSSGPMSSYSGSDEGNGYNINIIRGGILRKNGAGDHHQRRSSTTTTTSTSPSADELSECVVVRGKSVQVQGGSLQQQPQKIEVPFNLTHIAVADNSDDLRDVVVAPLSFKRKRPHGPKDSGMDSRPKKTKKADKSMQDDFTLKNIPTATATANSLSSDSSSQRWNTSPACNSSLTTVSFTSATTLGQGSLTSNLGVLSQVSSEAGPLFQQQQQKLNHSVPPLLLPHEIVPLKKCPQSIMAKSQQQQQQQQHPPVTGEERRLERNQREKERSNKIAHQVDALRSLLQRGGLFIPKNTKSSVLSEASNYIRTLQDRQQVMSMEMEALKRQMVETMAAKQFEMNNNGNNNNMPPIAAPQIQGGACAGNNNASSMGNENDQGAASSNENYHLIFKNTMAGMAVASMGGALLECNAAFHDNTGLSAEEMNGMTIFNVVHPADLPKALDLISRMIDSGYTASTGGSVDVSANSNPPSNVAASLPIQGTTNGSPEPVALRSSFYNRPDLGLCVSLIRGEDHIAKCFSITLVKNALTPPALNGNMSCAGNTQPIPFNPLLPSLPSLAPQLRKGGVPSSSLTVDMRKPC